MSLFPVGFYSSRSLLNESFDSVFNDFYDSFFKNTPSLKVKLKSNIDYPKWDIYEEKNKFIVEVNVPFMTKEDIKLELNDTEKWLRVYGESSNKNYEDDVRNYHIKELRRQKFERYISLPENIKGEPVVSLDKGILKIVWDTVKDLKPKDTVRKLEIK